MDFIDNYYDKSSFADETGFDRERAQRKAVSVVLPLIMEKELTQRQYLCLRYKYVSGKSQQEIAQILHLSQPTVSRHINAAKDIVNNALKYCFVAVSNALTEYDK